MNATAWLANAIHAQMLQGPTKDVVYQCEGLGNFRIRYLRVKSMKGGRT